VTGLEENTEYIFGFRAVSAAGSGPVEAYGPIKTPIGI